MVVDDSGWYGTGRSGVCRGEREGGVGGVSAPAQSVLQTGGWVAVRIGRFLTCSQSASDCFNLTRGTSTER